MENFKRKFDGIWIPKELWFDQNLTLQEKIFFIEINSLDNEDGCYATNEYFAKFFGLSKVRVSEVINSLINKNYIKRTLIYKENSKEIDQRILNVLKYPPTEKAVYPPLGKQDTPPLGKQDTPPLGKFIDNNTVFNNTLIKEEKEKINKKEKEVFEKTNSENSEEIYPVVEISKIWKNKFKNYYFDEETDFVNLRLIIGLYCSVIGVDTIEQLKPKFEQVRWHFEVLFEAIAMDKYLSKQNLSYFSVKKNFINLWNKANLGKNTDTKKEIANQIHIQLSKIKEEEIYFKKT